MQQTETSKPVESSEIFTGKIRESVRLIAIEHLHEALRAGLNHEAMRHVIAAIRVLER